MSEGGEGKHTAFWVVYITHQELVSAQECSLYHMSENTKYKALIPVDLQVLIEAQNEAFVQEYEEAED